MSLRLLLPALCAPLLMAAAPADTLPRRATLGVAIEAAPAGAEGVVVTAVMPQAGDWIGKLLPGDRIVAFEGRPLTAPRDLTTAVGKLKAGTRVEVAVVRDGKRATLKGRLTARPREVFRNGVARYSAVPFRGGQLREIMVTPEGEAKGPVLFILQGYTCAPVETANADTAHHQLIDGLLARGVSTYRVEKPRAGDSRGGPDCDDIDFETEVQAFQAGYRSLIETHGVSPDRIFLLGHSLGGLEAPIVASRGPAPRGVAVYGTLIRNWGDYLIDIFKYQELIARDGDPVKGEIAGERNRPIVQKIYYEGRTPAEVAAASAEDAKQLRDWFEWNGGTQLWGRHYSYWQGIAATPLGKAWSETRSRVLSIYGESDFEAIDDGDHRLIADVVNHYRPGTARYVMLEKSGHGMRLEGDRAQARARNLSAAPAPAPFNAALVPLLADWIDESMRQPPVR